MPQIDGGHLVAKALSRKGVRHVFTLCGGHIDSIYRACADEGVKIIDFRHEQSAAHAAEGWSRITGEPGVAVVTAGPGVTNVVTAVANASSACCPMILIGGKSPLVNWERGSLQELDQVALMSPITKWARTVVETRRIPEYLDVAFRQATSGKPGPVFVDIPWDVLEEEAEESEALLPTDYRMAAKPQGDPDRVKAAVDILMETEKAVAVAGSSVWWSQASEELRTFVETANIPVFLNGMARGSIHPDHKLFLSLSRKLFFREAEAIIVIGAPLDFRLGFGSPPFFPQEARLIQIDLDPADIGRNRAVDVGIVGDIKAILKQLTEEIQRRGAYKDSTWVERVHEEEENLRKADEPLLNSEAVPIYPLRLCKEIRDFIDRDATVVGDGGDIVTFAARVLGVYYPGHWLDPGPYGCLGMGAGFAIAAKLAKPDKQVLVLSGDGSFGLSVVEFETMVRHRLPIVSVIGNDGSWGQVKHGQLALYKKAIGTEFSAIVRYDKVVEDLGGYGELVEKPEDIRPALERAFASGLPSCVNVIIDPSASYTAYYREEASPSFRRVKPSIPPEFPRFIWSL